MAETTVSVVIENTEKVLKPSQEQLVGITPFLDKLQTIMVDIFVGPKKTLFRVHKSYLCRRIPYFDKMFNGSFKEAEGKAELPEDDPATFDLLMEWTYSANPRRLRNLESVTGDDGVPRATWDVVAFYSLAKKLCLPDLQDLIMNHLLRYHKRVNELPSPDFVHRAYNLTGEDSKLSDYALRSIHYILLTRNSDDYQDDWQTSDITKLFKDHPNFSHAYIDLSRTENEDDPRNASKCFFHVHSNDGPCPPNLNKRKYHMLRRETPDQLL